ncbi:MAG: putative reductive dehalogenase [Dehalococcoides mccartyi]|uniref:reductive dehalogenase n=1 Tax=Dehalococcoides mccartyi TaxID=61435 RepID=UPI002431725E|nr:reductive dehalogenase [Dehalococcoides mccartyi]MCF7635282.1 putative reductive dehalogenase [Dehalococcoides mccartyi]MEA2122252.1 hypothetical protein [Dehalococcoides mccartyi]
MSRFHSMVSRRDFMKAIGMAGAGAGAVAATTPVFHDLDELMSAPSVTPVKRPWWVKERELFNPTSEIDWDLMQRFDRKNEAHSRRIATMYRSVETIDAAAVAQKNIDATRIANQTPGFDTKYQALKAGYTGSIESPAWAFPGIVDEAEWAKTPAELGMPNWSGTPEENSRLLYAALRYYGATFIGYAEVEDKWRNKLFVKTTTDAVRDWTWTPENPDPPESDELRYVYEDVDQPYSELRKGSTGRSAGKHVIPSKPLWLITIATGACMEATKTLDSTISKSNSSTASNGHESLKVRTFNFVRALGGWRAFGDGGHQTSESNFSAAMILTGLAENSRQGNYCLTPETGPNHIPFTMLTDFPLEPTKPIDAGLFRFCHSCKKCANACPSQSISHEDEPSWDIPDVDGKPRVFCNPGHKGFWPDMAKCNYYSKGGGTSGCWVCYANCTFSEDKAAMMHNIIRGTVATTGLFNGFFSNMSSTFGYGPYESPEVWWDMSLPTYGFDSTVGAAKGGYSK